LSWRGDAGTQWIGLTPGSESATVATVAISPRPEFVTISGRDLSENAATITARAKSRSMGVT
jgi:hypothetical protein